MDYVRKETIRLVSNLTTKELDFNLDQFGNSIGTLLLHCAALEFNYQVETFQNIQNVKKRLALYEYAMPGKMILRRVIGNEIYF